ncbi:formyltetrahydrofolate deformylase [Streptomyces sp. NPDC096205]|uniref:formyltetrahydrofolate deformylase n=1 Tax=Streptomyces sp. NPDC096205 TaxID=3366081 RepID=UPI0037F37D7F
MTTTPEHQYALTLSCPDSPGIVHAVTGYLLGIGGDILDSQQYGDRQSGIFFLRVHFALGRPMTPQELGTEFSDTAARFSMTWQFHDMAAPTRVLVMVSKYGHCLNDLLFRAATGALPVQIAGVVSNCPDFEELAGAHGIPFHHIPVTPETKPEAERRLLDLVAEERIELVVLARYMQILSADVCKRLDGRIINIHHSFLPSFKGARPYHQAHTRGVKLIGATAHYVTADLDEGPIIEQDVVRVRHDADPRHLVALGRDIENTTLARAVAWHAEHRVLLNGTRTVVFS